ncbi:zf-HC2 domain-containing protein [Mumia qirimensis]|uniref:zf-HC2 domain-containing protein n=1 Tax=Mumia qirimensis TaxID=3234852 RepID=UPI00351D57D6
MSDPYATSDAAYVLGLLDDAERGAFERHLGSCADCRARVASVQPVAAALAGTAAVDVGDHAADVPLPETLLPGLVGRARAERRRRRRVLGGAAAAVAACAVTVVVAAWPTDTPSSGDRTSESVAEAPLTSLVDVPVSAAATLDEKEWGTQIVLDCRYGGYAGGGEARTYGLRVVDTDGRAYAVGSWSIAPGQEMTFRTGVALPEDRIEVIEVVRPGGAAILRLDRD